MLLIFPALTELAFPNRECNDDESGDIASCNKEEVDVLGGDRGGAAARMAWTLAISASVGLF